LSKDLLFYGFSTITTLSKRMYSTYVMYTSI